MERKSLDRILYCVKTHRCISSAQILKGVNELMGRHIREFVCTDKKGHSDDIWIQHMTKLTGIRDRDAIYADTVRAMNSLPFKDISFTTYRAEAFFILASIGSLKKSDDLYWLKLSAEDVMLEAGLKKYWDDFFAQDAGLWEKQKGYAPSIGDILKCCFEWYSDDYDEIFVCPAMKPLFDLKSVIPETPFLRKRTEYKFRYPWDAKEMNDNKRNASLIAIWVWYLMVAAPALLWDKEKICVSLYDCRLIPLRYQDEEYAFRKDTEALYRRNSM